MVSRYSQPGFCPICGKALKKFSGISYNVQTGEHNYYFACENPCHPTCDSKLATKTWKEFFRHPFKSKYITTCCGTVFFHDFSDYY